ncbi:MAG: hypothetical protein JO309_05610 [Pseudonocardiales bacterium]|nr:hypothetical protein [Pseudonocardiales bacterium]MBV9728876.1 hypothetical protein [Pseudonocardiales bacterium]
MIDKFFAAVYLQAYELGMMIEVLTNGSRLSNPLMLDVLTAHRPHRITLSVYGATEESYDALTQRRGAYKAFIRGLTAAHDAGLPLDLSVIVTRDNAHEIDQMHAIAKSPGWYGATYRDRLNVIADIDDIYYGLAFLRSKIIHGCLLTTSAVATATAKGDCPAAHRRPRPTAG